MQNYNPGFKCANLTCNICVLSLCTMLSLQWEPEIIAVAVMYLAGRLCKFDIQEWTSKQSSRRWWEQFVQDVPVELLEGRNLRITYNETFLVIWTPASIVFTVFYNWSLD